MRTVDLFAGCGGLSQGFINAGYQMVAAFENWNIAADCYSANFDHPVFRVDLSEVATSVKLIETFHPEIIIGGPPCQDFSHAGKRIEERRAGLTEAYANIVKLIRPRYFVMENVERAQRSDAYAAARRIFKESGYGLTERVLLASRCGVPQRRKRFFCIGILGGADGALNKILDSNLSEREMTVRDYLGDTLDVEYYYRHPRNYSRRAIFSIDEPAPTMRGVNRPVPRGYPGHPKDACSISNHLRPLTTLERSLIQTFPPSYRWLGSKTDREQMIGNAVPVNLGTYVAQALKIFINTERENNALALVESFARWLEEAKGFSARAARDVKSRLTRANSALPIAHHEDPSVYLAMLEHSVLFEEISPSVKSQIRRSVRLYFEYATFKESSSQPSKL